MIHYNYTGKIEEFDRFYFEEIERKRWEAIQKRKLLIDGILQEVYDSIEEYRLDVSLLDKPLRNILDKPIVYGYRHNELVCLDYHDCHIKLLRLSYPNQDKRTVTFSLCIPYEELGLYAVQKDLPESIMNIIRLRLEGKLEGAKRDDALIRKYLLARALLDRQNNYVSSTTYILQNFISDSIKRAYGYMKWYDRMTSEEPIVSLIFSGRTYLYQGGKFLHTPEKDYYTIDKKCGDWKMVKRNRDIL